ncbi:MAG: hypothetical protein OFPI_42170 [Osedax symbiont Rs2]|nr:MAG: hypothetical protein OFPI_42170 [Osedax symbiont Rs2]
MKKIILLSLLASLPYNSSHASNHANEPTADQSQTDKTDTDNTQAETAATRVAPKPRADLQRDLALLLQNSLTQVVQLSALDQQFDLYYLEAEAKKPVGSILFFPDDRGHSNWPVTLAPLREGLPRYDWQTAVITQPEPVLAATPARTSYADTPATEQDTGDDPAAEDSIVQPNAQASSASELAGDNSDAVSDPTLAEITIARASAASQMLKEQSPLLILIGIGQGATWATAFAAGIDKSAKDNTRLLLINAQQSEDISAPKLIELIGDLKIDTIDIYSQRQNSSSYPWQEARKRAANRSEMENYMQIAAPNSAWSRSGNNWLFRKVYGLLKNQVLKPLQQKAAEAAAQPQPAKKRNQRPGSNSNN